MQVFGMSDVGMKRSLNEDNFIANVYNGTAVAVVCDGMGGANAGEVASRIACRKFISEILPQIENIKSTVTDESEFILRMDRAIISSTDASNAQVYQTAKEDDALDGMGTTLSGCIVHGENVWTFNVGDSRVYSVNDGGVRQLTVDHSFVQALLDDGKITEEEARQHPNRNLILRALGVTRTVECDISHFKNNGGYYLVCSDGMSNYYDEKEFYKTVTNDDDALSDKVQSLIRLANSKGGADNITAVLIDTQIDKTEENNEQ